MIFAAALVAAPAPVRAGRWHRGDTLICSDCHTMHNSSRGQPMRYDEAVPAAPLLLRSATTTSLCLSCHGGQNASAPKVSGSTLGDPPAGGFPADLADPDHLAHNLDGLTVTPPAGDTPVQMTCTACHDPHGSANYRNLRPSPSGTGRAASVPVIGVQKPATGGPEQVYTRANVVYVSGLSTWCLDCHDTYEAQSSHPWDRPIYGSWATDYAWWSTGTFNPRAPVQSPLYVATDTAPAVPSQDDEVFCLSCHKAHGSTLYKATLDFGDSSDPTSLCNQCHNM